MDSTPDTEIIQFDSKQQAAELALELVQTARREICFFGADIDQPLFDNVSMLMVVKDFLRSGARCQLRMLVHDSRPSISNSHRMLPLFERMSSRCQLHLTDTQHKDIQDSFLLVDNKAWLYCQSHGRYQGRASEHEPLFARELAQRFELLWNHSSPDPHSRRLHI